MRSELDDLIEDLSTSDKLTDPNERISYQINAFKKFNKKNESKFRFDAILEENDAKTNLIQTKYLNLLDSCWTFLNSNNSVSDLFTLNVSLASQLLDSIRLISRDKKLIKLFERHDLLETIKQMANLSLNHLNEHLLKLENEITNNVTKNAGDLEKEALIYSLNVFALKCISNLIYNSSFTLNYFVNNNVAEAIIIHLKLFNTSELLNAANDTNISDKKNIMLFNLRILFLLTALNKELRQKLEKLQLISYLVEIIDQIMKERLNVKDLNLNDLNLNNLMSSNNEQDYCYLKSNDIDYLNEILKTLYNLTMDLDSVKENSLVIGPMTPFNISNQQKSPNKIVEVKQDIEEEEAHLMHLVSILRDLITCKVESESASVSPAAESKLTDLYANIINVLTNMPSTCFDELLTPVLANITAAPHVFQFSTERVKKLSQKNMDIRIAQSIKRNTRTSKRKIKKSSNSSNSLTSPLSISPKLPQSSSQSVSDLSPSESDLLTLMSMDEDMEFEGKNMEAVAIVLSFMSRFVTSYLKRKEESDKLYPVLLLLILMSKSNKIIRHYCRLKVLPPLTKQDLLNLPQNGLTIRNRLAKLMTDANLQIKRLAAQFLYVLCKESVSRLIKYTGYGNAAGLLVDLGIMASNKPSNTIEEYSSDSDNDSEDYKNMAGYINPVTGRAELDKNRDMFEGMSEEQKEYEAVQLANAFDKLSRLNGIIKPATFGPDGRPVEIEHVLQLQEEAAKLKDSLKLNKSNTNEGDSAD